MRLDLGSASENLALRHDFNDHDMAQAVCYSPLGDQIFVALQGEVRYSVPIPVLKSVVRQADAPQGPQR